MSNSALAFAAGFGGGYFKGKQQNRENERQDKADKQRDDLYEMTMAEKRQALADKEALRAAGSDIGVTEETKPFQSPADSMDNDMPVAAAKTVPLAKSYKVGAKDFAADGVAAQAEADKLNTPEGKRTRTMAALAAQGNVVGADQMRTSGIQADAAALTLKEGQQAAADKALKRQIDGLKTPDEIADFVSKSQGDRMDGQLQARAVASADGKTFEIMRVLPDGTMQAMGGKYEHSPKGMDQAKMLLAGFMTPEQRLAHYQGEETRAETARHNKATEDLAKQKLEADAKQARLTNARADAIAAGKAKAGEPVQLTLKDMREFESDLTGHIKDQFPVKDGLDEKERALMNAQATQIKSTAQSIFKTNAAQGTPLTAGTVMQAMELGKDPKNVRVFQDPTTGNKFTGVIVNGQPVAISGVLQDKPQPAAAPVAVQAVAPAAPVAAPPAAMAAQGVQPAPQQAPMNTADQIQAQNIAKLQPLAEQVKQANQQFVAVAKSGDANAIGQYMQRKETLRLQLEKQVTEKFGNAAPRVLQQLMAQQ